jgi:hypothetical protein
MSRKKRYDHENVMWSTRIHNANRYYQQWEERFKCRKLEEYREGYQWRNIVDIPFYRPYVVNLVYAELKKKMANILYQNIEFTCSPRPGNYGVNPDFAFQSSAVKQDFLNEIIARENKDNSFNQSIELCAMDSFFRFAVMEIGYGADWKNPKKSPLVTESHYDDSIADSKDKVVEDIELPENERIYFRRIKPSRFRVSVSDDPHLANCSWSGYYSYIYKSTLLNNKDIKLPKDFDTYDFGVTSEFISAKGDNNSNRASSDSKDMLEALKQGKVCKVWHIWDNECKTRLLLLEPSFEVIWDNEKSGGYEYLPFATHRHDLRLDGWYPIPPIYQWIAPQDEINQAREQMRNYRRRFTRKFKYYGIDQEELEKFKSEIDGEVIKLKTPNSILESIGNPEIGISIQDALNAGRDDFNIVSGSSSDLSTAQADRTTATQSKITAGKAQIIETVEEIHFTKFYKQIGRITLLVAQENFSNGLWVKSSLNPSIDSLSSQNPAIIPVFKYVTTQQLQDGFDCDIDINPINASPQKMQEEFEKLIKYLTTVQSFPILGMSPDLIREVAYRLGYRNEKVIQEMMKIALMQVLQQQAQQGQQGQGKPQVGGDNGAAKNAVRNAVPSSQEAIQKQLIGQVR